MQLKLNIIIYTSQNVYTIYILHVSPCIIRLFSAYLLIFYTGKWPFAGGWGGGWGGGQPPGYGSALYDRGYWLGVTRCFRHRHKDVSRAPSANFKRMCPGQTVGRLWFLLQWTVNSCTCNLKCYNVNYMHNTSLYVTPFLLRPVAPPTLPVYIHARIHTFIHFTNNKVIYQWRSRHGSIQINIT